MTGSARVKVASFDDRIAAEIARGQLEAHGIEAWIEADDVGGAYPSLQLSRVRLYVGAADAAAASDALLPVEASEDDPPERNAVEESGATRSAVISKVPLHFRVGFALVVAPIVFYGVVKASMLPMVAVRRTFDPGSMPTIIKVVSSIWVVVALGAGAAATRSTWRHLRKIYEDAPPSGPGA